MGVAGALVLLAVIWFVVLFVVLPLRLTTQGDAGDVVPGTQPGAPAKPDIGRRLRVVTLVAVVLWAVIAGIVISGMVSLCDIDWFNRLDCSAAGETGG